MWLGLISSVMGNAPPKRVSKSVLSLGSTTESLPPRALLSCLEIGDYTAPGTPETGPLTLHVNGVNEDGDQFAFLTNGDFNIRMRVKCKPSGDIILKCATTKGGPKGTIIALEAQDHTVIYETHLKGKHSPDIGPGGVFTPTNN